MVTTEKADELIDLDEMLKRLGLSCATFESLELYGLTRRSRTRKRFRASDVDALAGMQRRRLLSGDEKLDVWRVLDGDDELRLTCLTEREAVHFLAEWQSLGNAGRIEKRRAVLLPEGGESP